jgi:hypothetical protein
MGLLNHIKASLETVVGYFDIQKKVLGDRIGCFYYYTKGSVKTRRMSNHIELLILN